MRIKKTLDQFRREIPLIRFSLNIATPWALLSFRCIFLPMRASRHARRYQKSTDDLRKGRGREHEFVRSFMRAYVQETFLRTRCPSAPSPSSFHLQPQADPSEPSLNIELRYRICTITSQPRGNISGYQAAVGTASACICHSRPDLERFQIRLELFDHGLLRGRLLTRPQQVHRVLDQRVPVVGERPCTSKSAIISPQYTKISPK